MAAKELVQNRILEEVHSADQRKNGSVKYILLGVAFPILIGCVAFLCLRTYQSESLKNAREHAIEVLRTSINTQTVTLNAQLEGERDLLAAFAETVGSWDNPNMDDLFTNMEAIVDSTDMLYLGIADSSGNVRLQNGGMTDASNREYFNSAMRGEPCMERIEDSRLSSGVSFILSEPIYKNGAVIGAALSSYDEEAFRALLRSSAYHGAAYSYLCDKNGNILIGSDSPDHLANEDNLLHFLAKATLDGDGQLQSVRKAMLSGEGGVLRYSQDEQRRYGVYEPLGVNDWFMFCIAPAEAVEADVTFLTEKGTWLMLEIMICAIAMIVYICLLERRRRSQLRSAQEARILDFMTDRLTGLLNEHGLLEAAPKLVAHRLGRIEYYLIYVEFARFSDYKLLYGEEAGNELLRGVARTLLADANEYELCAHQFEGSFLCLYQAPSGGRMIDRLRKLDIQLGKLLENQIFGIRYGVYQIENAAVPMGDMIARARVAANQSEGSQRRTITFYEDSYLMEQMKEKRLLVDMKQALKNSEFIVEYQPQYDLVTRTLRSAEALSRWQRPDGAMIAPDVFIPLFEKNGCITQLDFYVLDKVCCFQKNTLEKGLKPIPIAVNFSRVHLFNPRFVDRLHALVREYDVRPELIEIEITESAFFADFPLMGDTVRRLREKGYPVAMDDFGSGYSTLHLLKELPIDKIKLDRCFLDESSGQAMKRRGAILKNIIRMGNELGIITLCEGIETIEQLSFLKQFGCRMGQGWYLSKSIQADAFRELLKFQPPCGPHLKLIKPECGA